MSIRVDRFRAYVSRRARVKIGDTLAFVEDPEFLEEFRSFGLDDDDLDSVQMAITACPKGGDVVPVTTHVRDMFYCLSEDTTVIIRYAYLESANTVLLLTAYYGSDVLPMTAAEASEAEMYVEEQTTFFNSRHTR